MKKYLIGLLISLFTLQANAGSLERLFAPKAELWSIWQQHDDNNTAQISHRLWSSWLQSYVRAFDDGVNRIDYAKVTAADRKSLKQYLGDMQQIQISSYARDEQKAYWVNLYNALTVDVVLEHYPVESIRDIDISPGFFADGPWGKKLLNIEGQAVSLNDIEHRILRPIWRDARIHYALNCASTGCPNLLAQSYDSKNIEANLEQAARDYVNHERGVHLHGKDIHLSSIYNWFQSDFGSSASDVFEHLRQYASAELKSKLANTTKINGYEYDWSLNDANPPKVTQEEDDDF